MKTRPQLISFFGAIGCCLGFLAACHGQSPALRVRSATEIGVVATQPAIQGRDGGFSIAVWNRSVWVYGDTVLTVPDEDGATWHHNSFSITADLDASDGITGATERLDAAGAPLHFLAPTPDERAFNLAHAGETCEEPCNARWATWPTAAVYDPERDRVLVFYGKIYAEPGDFNFHGVGHSIAVWDGIDTLPRRPELAPGTEHPTVMFPLGDRQVGLAPTIEGEHLYAFACELAFVVHECALARVLLEQALERTAWRFWTGSDWSPDGASATVVLKTGPIMDVAWNAYLGRYTAIYSRPFDLDIVIRTAPALTGPWSDEEVLFVARSDGDVYDALPHREYAERDGKVQYITYSRPTHTAWLATEFPVVRVELERTEP